MFRGSQAMQAEGIKEKLGTYPICSRIEGMSDFLLLPVSHPLMTKSAAVLRSAHQFLNTGQFLR